MLIIGAKGHAKEIIEILKEQEICDFLFFFDNVSSKQTKQLYEYPILHNLKEAEKLFITHNQFSLGIGNPFHRENLSRQFLEIGGQFVSIISTLAVVGKYAIIDKGVNIMPFAAVYNNAQIGKGVLINSFSSVHHDSVIGEFCEISPGARVLGNCIIGKSCSIGANAVILPNIKIAENSQIGAGCIVTKNIEVSGKYVGVPAKKII